MDENREICKTIAEQIEAYCDSAMYRCPECRAVFAWNDAQYRPEESEYTCPACKVTYDEDDLQALSLYDYLRGDYYDVEYRVGSDGEYRSVEVMVAGGGPNIYVDTKDNAVKLYWWNERAEYCLSTSPAEAIDQYFEEQFHAIR